MSLASLLKDVAMVTSTYLSHLDMLQFIPWYAGTMLYKDLPAVA